MSATTHVVAASGAGTFSGAVIGLLGYYLKMPAEVAGMWIVVVSTASGALLPAAMAFFRWLKPISKPKAEA